MKAALFHEYGPPDVLKFQDWPDPVPRAGEVRIKVHAATVNRVLDVALRRGAQTQREPVMPCIPGVDCAGLVDMIGPGVTRWKIGDKVAGAGTMPLNVVAEDGLAAYTGPKGMMGVKRPGGFAQYVYLPWNAVVHHVPKGVSPELAGLVTPMANGIEWSLFEGKVGYNDVVLIQGPGQQGLSQTVICKQAGAKQIIITGTSKDHARLEVAKKLGADVTIDVNAEDPLQRIMEVTGGRGVDVVLDCTAGAGTIPIMLGIEALKRKAGRIVVQGEMPEFPNFPIGKMTTKYITMYSARGHSYLACELALQQLASQRFPLDLVTTHKFGLNEVDLAIKSVGNKEGGVKDVIHASLMPWL